MMIKIEQLLPFLKKGWVAMDSDNEWYWHKNKPFKNMMAWDSQFCDNLSMFDIAPADDWETSLIRVGGYNNVRCIEDNIPHRESTVLFMDEAKQ